MKRFVLFLSLLAVVLPLRADEAAFDRYRIIMDNTPFGKEEEEVEEVVQPPPPATNWAADYRISMLRDSNGEVSVGLVHEKTKKGLILVVGGEADPDEQIRLVAADIEKGEVMLERGGDTRSLSLGERSFLVRGGPQVAPQAPRPSQAQQNARRQSFRERMEERRRRIAEQRAQAQQQQQQQPQRPRLSQEELNRHLENYQVQAVQQGLPPLPVPITPEMEQRIINETQP